MERGVGSVIRISLPRQLPEEGGIKLVPNHYEGNHETNPVAPRVKPTLSPESEAFRKIDSAPPRGLQKCLIRNT